jgi:hypothetical protein
MAQFLSSLLPPVVASFMPLQQRILEVEAQEVLRRKPYWLPLVRAMDHADSSLVPIGSYYTRKLIVLRVA